MPSNVIDSLLFKDQYGTEAMRNIFSDEAILQSWLDTEAGLASAEAELGLIPKEAAAIIKEHAKVENMDFDTIREGMKETSHPLITMIRSLEQHCGDYAGGFVHWGATTQDITDTGSVLQMKSAHRLLKSQLTELLEICLRLSVEYKSTIMPGRTHGQHALPITFGYKIAIWADEIGRHLERLNEAEHRYLVGQFGGAAGTLASLGQEGIDVREKLFEILELHSPVITWHVARDGFAEFSMQIGMIAGTVGKIANEIINLQRTELGEVEEGFAFGKVGSSTMPHKRNPMICEYIVGLSHLVRKKASLGLDCMVQEHERDMTFWQTEWSYIPEICISTSGALEQLQGVLGTMIVHEDRMSKNLFITKGLIVSENVMLVLGKSIGRQTAHDVIYDASMKAFEEDKTLKEMLLQDTRVTKYLTVEEIEKAVDPYAYVGLCETFVSDVYKKWNSFTAVKS